MITRQLLDCHLQVSPELLIVLVILIVFLSTD